MGEKKEVTKIDRMKTIQPKSEHARKTTLPGPTKEVKKSSDKILMIIRSQTGHDFSLYKKSTIHSLAKSDEGRFSHQCRFNFETFIWIEKLRTYELSN
jgi:hypothetical protein